MHICPICQSESEILFSHKLNKSIYREYFLCSMCLFIFVPNEFHIENIVELERYQNHNNNIIDEKLSFDENINNNHYLQILNNFLDLVIEKCDLKNSRITNHLDFGSGPKPNLSTLLTSKIECISTNYDTYYSPIDLSDFNTKIELLTSTEVWEHFRNPILEIEKQTNLLKTNGYIAVMTNLTDNLFSSEVNCKNNFKEWWYKNDITHISFYNSKTVEYLAKKYNLKVIFNNKTNIFILQK